MLKDDKKRIALLVSANAPDLNSGMNDLSSVFHLLKEEGIGCCHKRLSDVLPNCKSKLEFSGWIEKKLENWEAHDQLIFYYSGHGTMLKEKFAFEFKNKKGKITYELFENFVLELIHTYNISNCIFIIDACHSGAVTNLESSKSGNVELELPRNLPTTGIAYITSSSSEIQRSFENQESNISIFTELLVKGLQTGLNGQKTHKGVITIEEIVSFINEELEKESYQQFKQRAKARVGNFSEKFWIALNVSGAIEDIPKDELDNNSLKLGHGEVSKLYDVTPLMHHPCSGIALNDLDWDLVSEYYKVTEGETPNKMSKESILEKLNFFSPIPHMGAKALRKDVVTCFHKNPVRFMPWLRTRVTIDGKVTTMSGPVSRQIEKILNLIDEYSEFFLIDYKGKRQESDFIGSDAFYVIREILSNSFAHRDYFEKTGYNSVRIAKGFVEISNPGNLYALWEDLLEESQSGNISKPVNDSINEFLLLLGYFEGRGGGFLKISNYRQNYGRDSIICKSSINGSITITVKINQGIAHKNTIEQTFIAYGESKIPHALTPLPFSPEVFLGRDRELEDIRSLLFSGTSLLLLVNGEGGVGKTSLASRYFHTYQYDYAHIAWVLSEKNITNALLLLAPKLGLTFEDRQPATERLEKLLTAMASLNRPCLLVIDNANDPEDLEANYQHLRRCSNFHLLLTTRITTFERAGTYTIQGLPEDKALKLFRRHYTKFQPEIEGALFQQLYAAVGGNTLVLELLAKNLALRNQLKTRYALTDLLTDLREKGLLQLSQSQAVHTDYQSRGGGMRHEKPEDIIAAMYELSELLAEEVALLSVFAVLPAESIAFEMLEKLLPDAESLEDELFAMAQKGWIEYNEAENAFKCSPVVQEIAKKKNPNLHADCEALIATLIDKLDYEPDIGHLLNATYEEAAHLVRYAEAVFYSLPEPDQNLSTLADRIGNFYQATGNLEQALAYYKAGMEMNKALVKRAPDHADHKNNLAISCQNLGNVQRALGNLEETLTFYEKDLELTKELHESFPDHVPYKNGLAISYSKFGNVQSALGNLEAALTFYEQYNALEKELHASFPEQVEFKNGLAISYEKLGTVQSALGNLELALTFYENETKLFEELHESFPDQVSYKNGLAISYQKLGNAQSALGNLEAALTFYEQYNALEKELYESFPEHVEFKNSLAISYQKLGNAQSALGNLEAALTFYEKDLELTKELHESFPDHVEFKNGLAISHWDLGKLYRETKNKEDALSNFQISEKLWKALASDYPLFAQFKKYAEMVLKEIEITLT